MLTKRRSELLASGREAALAALRGEAPPPNPFRPALKSHHDWQCGFDQTTRLVARIMDIGA